MDKVNMDSEKYGFNLRLAELEDAKFILSLRTNPLLNQFLSATSDDLEKQIEWIRQYKQREKNNQEYYFVAEIDGIKYGTTRLYNFDELSFEAGSWLFSKETPAGLAIKADIIGRRFGFEALNATYCKFKVRKENKSVIRYHMGYQPTLITEDELNYYFKLSRANFENHSEKLLKLI